MHIEWVYTHAGYTESASDYQNRCVYSGVSKILKHMPHWNLCVVTLTSKESHSHHLRWSDIARICLGYFFFGFLSHFPCSMTLGLFLVSILIAWNSMESYEVILLLYQCSCIHNQVLYGDDQPLKEYKPESAYIFGRELLKPASIAGSLGLNEGREKRSLPVQAVDALSQRWVHVCHTKSYLMACCLPSASCKCAFDW